jgi:YegS/Rv2252/BmrU family lipid kinase
MSHAKVIVNPVAGGGSIRRRWPRICSQLHEVGLSFDYEFTKSPGHAIEIAEQAINTGYSYLIAVGGDGTVNEVANGILNSAHSDDMVLGIISTGTACGFARSLGVQQNGASSLAPWVSQGRTIIDACVVEFQNHGQQLRRFFVNEASIGFGAAVVNTWKRLPNCFGHTVNNKLRATSSYVALITHRNKRVKLRIDNENEDICACYLVVANGQFFADGMRIAPHAMLNDGWLNLVTIGDVSKSELLRIVPTVYAGGHIKHPEIRERQAKVVTVECNERLLVEADGEILGECPASFWVIPSALTVVV